MRIWVQKSASMQKRTSPLKFAIRMIRSIANRIFQPWSAPQWQPPPQQSFDAPAFEYPTGAELNYAAPYAAAGYEQPEYGYYGATELNYAAAEPAMSGGRFSEPLEVTAGSPKIAQLAVQL